jgi:CBS-domain-containing membrane protein
VGVACAGGDADGKEHTEPDATPWSPGAAEKEERDPMLVGDRMSSPAVTIPPDMVFRDASRLMRTHGIRRLPVVDEDGVLVGIVGRENVIVVGTQRKVRALDCLRVDTGDAALDETLSGSIRVIVGYREWMMVEVRC